MSQDGVSKIVRDGYCTGCGLCEALLGVSAVQMTMSPAGYLRPRVVGPVSDADVHRVRAVCPGVALDHPTRSSSFHPIWGPLTAVRTGFSTDPEARHLGSSGGVVTALALHLLKSGKVCFVAQIAASRLDPLLNAMQISRSRSDVLRAAGSRYAPSAPLSGLNELLNLDEPFALIGKPCDIAAVRRLARIDPRIDRLIPYLLSFMCAGIPSQHGTLELLARMGTSAKEVTSFRYRGDGWPGKARATTADGSIFELDYATSWGTILNRHLQFRCKICPDGTGEFADVVCADAWYGKDGYPDFEERAGRSLILTRTQRGEELVRAAMNDGDVETSPLDTKEIARMQPYQVQRKTLVLGRIIGTLLRRGTSPRFRRMGLMRASLMTSARASLRSAIGTFKRAQGESWK